MSGRGLFEELPHDSAWRSAAAAGGFTGLVSYMAITSWQLSERAGLNHDAAMFLYCGRLILEGAVPYVDFVEINPPLVMYLSVFPAALAPIPDLAAGAFGLWSGLLFALSLIGIAEVLKHYHKEIPVIVRWLLVTAWILFTYWLLTTPEINFGQREHLFLMFYLPYFFLRIARFDGAKITPFTAVLLGSAAGVGACLKPHFVFIVLLVEAYLLISRRKIRLLFGAEFLALVTFGFAYAIHFLFLPDAMREALFHRWVPMIVGGYGAYDVPFSQLLRSPSLYVAAILIVVCSILAARYKLPGRRLVGPVSALTIASILAYFLGHKGWPYHLIPVWFGSSILAVLVLAAFLSKVIPNGFAPVDGKEKLLRLHGWVALIGFLLLILLPISLIGFRSPRSESGRNPIDSLLSYLPLKESTSREYNVPSWMPSMFGPSAPRDPVLIISTSVAEVFPRVVDLDLEIASRYLWTFPIALLYADAPDYPEGFPYHPMEESPPDELQFLQELGDDIVNNAPKVIVIDHDGQSQGCPVGFNPADYLRVNGFIDRYMTNYKEPLDIMGKKVYYRKDVYS